MLRHPRSACRATWLAALAGPGPRTAGGLHAKATKRPKRVAVAVVHTAPAEQPANAAVRAAAISAASRSASTIQCFHVPGQWTGPAKRAATSALRTTAE